MNNKSFNKLDKSFNNLSIKNNKCEHTKPVRYICQSKIPYGYPKKQECTCVNKLTNKFKKINIKN